ncbi:MAG: cyclic nucleotide-binding domain-containing protein [Thermodesulfobacteriota bacterium]|nr:cyclic nucleotide-binding domain-containing protein [Thermodesulfobacteriota bacterium]
MKEYKVEGKEIFSHLTPKQVAEISDIATIKNCEEGEIIFDRGQTAKNIYILLEGEVALRLPSGKDMSYEEFSLEIDRIKDHGVFGPGLMFGVRKYITRAKTTKSSKIMMIDAEKFIDIIRENKSEFSIMSYLANTYFHRYINTMKEFQQYLERRKFLET